MRRGTMATALVVVVFAGCGGCGGTSTPSTPRPMPSGPWYCTFIRCDDGGIVTPGPRCSPATCSGCCDVNGLCQPGNTDFACGRGQACANCTGFAGQCVFNSCVVLNEPPRCSAANCRGCCTLEGLCSAGTTDPSCGPRGTICTTCDPTSRCEQQQCVRRCSAATCPGCCDLNGGCVQGFSNAVCGRGGVACQTCAAPSTCGASGVCVAPPSCSACQPGECCSNSVCVPVGPGTCAATGIPNAECRLCPAPGACGGGTERGFCVNAGTRPLGAPCLWDGECAPGAGSGRPTCLTGLAWPGGYCSDTCTATTCLAPDLCWTFQSQNICLKGCSTPGASCGDAGTVCDVVGSSTSSACIPKCTPASAAAQCVSGRCHGDGRCCGSSDKACCDTGAACSGPGADGGVSACLPSGRCS
ncbi:MAG: hypothetical protein Q8S33_32680 [Myxococcales bacterium]|nr:hypothetical protein [Myxococcales bacterium]